MVEVKGRVGEPQPQGWDSFYVLHRDRETESGLFALLSLD